MNNLNILAALAGALRRCRPLAWNGHAARSAPFIASREYTHNCPYYSFTSPKLLFLALFCCGVVQAASLSARLDKSAITLGEPVRLTIEARNLSLDALDISPITSSFDVAARTLSRGADHETLELTLYPRGVGALSVPPLQVHTQRTTALALKVANGSDSVPRVTANWTLTPALPLVNQPTRLTLSICDDGSLQWQRPVLPTSTGRLVRALGEEEGEGMREGEACTLHTFHWALVATQSGAAALSTPMLDANRFGQRLRFPGPALGYQASALPAWLPAHVPPLAPQVEADPLPARWPLQRPLAWHVQVTGGYSAEGIKALLDMQLRDTPMLGVYPPLIEVVVPDDLVSPLSRYAITLYFQPRADGQLNIPDLRLPWFDAARGQLETTIVKGRTVTIFDPRWQRAALILGGLAGLLVLAGLAWQIRHMARWRLARRRGLQDIRQAQDAAGLARAVRRFSLKDDPMAAPSLDEWVRQLRQESVACEVEGAVKQLEQIQFGQTAMSLGELKQSFLSALAHVRPKRLFGRFIDRRWVRT